MNPLTGCLLSLMLDGVTDTAAQLTVPSPLGTPFPSAEHWFGSYFNHSVVDPDPYPHHFNNLNPDPHQIKIWMRSS